MHCTSTHRSARSWTGILPTALALLMASPLAAAGDWSVNTFRNPSIGIEYRSGDYSFHTGYYTTILRDRGDAAGEASGFIRTGVTRWIDDRYYVSLSHLRGVDGARDGRDFAIVDAGVQFRPWPRVGVRLGVALIPAAHGFARKVNPTPGVNIEVPL